MDEYLYLLTAERGGMVVDGPTPEEEPVLARHSEYLRGLADEGTVILAGRTQNRDPEAFGIVVFRAEDRERAEQIMTEDPAVAAGVMRAQLFPYRIAFQETRAPSSGRE